MIESLFKNIEIRKFLENFSQTHWSKAIEAGLVYGIRMFRNHSIPADINTIQNILSHTPNDIRKTITKMKRDIKELNSSIKRIERRENKSDFQTTSNSKFAETNMRSSYEKHRANSSKGSSKIDTYSNDRSNTPGYSFQRELKEPKVCPLNDAQKYTKILSTQPEDPETKVYSEFLKSKASLSTGLTSPQMQSIIFSPRDHYTSRY